MEEQPDGSVLVTIEKRVRFSLPPVEMRRFADRLSKFCDLVESEHRHA